MKPDKGLQNESLITSEDPFLTNSTFLEEEHFNVTEHRGFLHGFVEAISVIVVGGNPSSRASIMQIQRKESFGGVSKMKPLDTFLLLLVVISLYQNFMILKRYAYI